MFTTTSLKISVKYCYRLIIVLVVLNILMNHNSGVPEAAAQDVHFPDTNLAAAVRKALNLGATDAITQTRLNALVDLPAHNAGIRALTGLESATNLQRLSLALNRIRDIRPLSGLTNLQWLDISDNPITDLSPLSTLLNLETLFVDQELHEKNPGVLARVIPADTQIYFRRNSAFAVKVTREQLNPPRVPRCGLGWAPASEYEDRSEQPKVMIYALEFAYSQQGYTCSAIEIRTGDATISHLEGWRLYLGTLHNQSSVPIELTQANSQITHNVLRLTPETLGLETFLCSTIGGISHPLPGVHYVLKTDGDILVDSAYSCFIWGQTAWTTVNGKNVESQRRISSAALHKMETPRIERYITDPMEVFITYTGIENFGWDREVFSDWLLALSEETEVAGGNAPSAVYKKLTTSWAALKKPGILRRNEKRR